VSQTGWAGKRRRRRRKKKKDQRRKQTRWRTNNRRLEDNTETDEAEKEKEDGPLGLSRFSQNRLEGEEEEQ